MIKSTEVSFLGPRQGGEGCEEDVEGQQKISSIVYHYISFPKGE